MVNYPHQFAARHVTAAKAGARIFASGSSADGIMHSFSTLFHGMPLGCF
jgi:hypothetical protein